MSGAPACAGGVGAGRAMQRTELRRQEDKGHFWSGWSMGNKEAAAVGRRAEHADASDAAFDMRFGGEVDW